MKKAFLLFISIWLATLTCAWSQTTTVTGKVTDASNVPIIGVNILEKNTNNGVATDFDGNYSITVSSNKTILQFSSLGFSAQETEVGNRTTINIILEDDATGLEEVILVGYGATVKKKDVTGSQVRADLSIASETSNVSIIQSLQGTMPGVNVGPVTSAGASPSLTVRGVSTLDYGSGANAPLIVLDGIVYSGSLVDLNTADIESLDVLKDVSASAIYGTQGANGVILITSKKGSKSNAQPQLNYSTSYTIQSPSNKLTPMKADEYETFYPDIYWADGGRIGPDYLQVNPNYVWQNNFKTLEIAEGYTNGVDYPWWETFTGNGEIQQHNISLSGRGDSVTYFLSGGVTDQKGFQKNDDYKKYNFRVNVDAKVNDWLNVGTQTFITISDYSGISAGTAIPFALQPWAPATDIDGEFLPNPEGGWLNPHLTIKQEDSDIRTNFLSTLFAKVKLPIKGLTYTLNYSNNLRRSDRSIFNPNANNFQGSASKSHGIARDWTFDNILNYNKTFDNDHNLNVTLLYGSSETTSTSTVASSRNFVVDFLGYDRLEAGDPSLNGVNSGKSVSNKLYQMGRLLYNYKNKYYFTGTIRRDGFSGFGDNNKTAVFPSFGLAWNLSEESFLSNIEWMNFLKLKGSYGQTGRQGIGPYATRATVSSGPAMVFGDGGSTFLGQSVTRLANNNLKWETTTGLNAGLDFTLLNSRLSGTVDYYENTTEDILFSIVLPRITGFSSISDNIAEVSNSGIDISLTGKIVDNKDFKWSTSVAFSRNRNIVESIIGADNDGDGVEDDLISSGIWIGETRNVLYDYEVTGMWQLSEDNEGGDGSIWQGFLPGTYKLNDLNGDDEISSLDDKKILGYTDPSYRLGITNNVSYKNFNLHVMFNSIQGGKDRYYGNDSPTKSGLWNNREQLGYSNVPSGAWDYWMPENPNAKYPRLDNRGSYGGTRYTQRNFVRLQDVSLSYNLPTDIISEFGLSNLKLFVSGKNLATWTNWRGWDPETGAGFEPGVPLLSSYTLGLNVQF